MVAENRPNLYDKINSREDAQEQEMQDKLDVFLKEPGNHKKIRKEVTKERLHNMGEGQKDTIKNAAIALMEFEYPGDEDGFEKKSYDQINWFVNGQYNHKLPSKVQDRGKREGALYSLVYDLEGKGVLQANKVSTQIDTRKERQTQQTQQEKQKQEPVGEEEQEVEQEEQEVEKEVETDVDTNVDTPDEEETEDTEEELEEDIEETDEDEVENEEETLESSKEKSIENEEEDNVVKASAPENIAIKHHTETMRAREAQRSIDGFLGGLIGMPNENGEYDPQDAELTDDAKDTLRMSGIFNKKKAQAMASGLASLGQLTQQAKTFEEKTKIMDAAMKKMSEKSTSIFTDWKLDRDNTLIGIVATKKSGKERRIQRNSREEAVSAQVWKITESRGSEKQKLEKDAYKRDVQENIVNIDTSKTEEAEALYDETQEKSQEKQTDMLSNMSNISATLTEFSTNMTRLSELEATIQVVELGGTEWTNTQQEINEIQQKNNKLIEQMGKQRADLQSINFTASLETTMTSLEDYITSIDNQQEQVNDNMTYQVEVNLQVSRNIKNGLLEKVKNTTMTKDDKEETYSDLLNTITNQAKEGLLEDEVWGQKASIEQDVDQLQQRLDGYAIEEKIANQRVIYAHLAGHRRAQEVTDQKISVIDNALANVRENKDETVKATEEYRELVLAVISGDIPEKQKESMLSGLEETMNILTENMTLLATQEDALAKQKAELKNQQEQITQAIDKSQQYINLLSNYTDLSVSQQRLENMNARKIKNQAISTNIQNRLDDIEGKLSEQKRKFDDFEHTTDMNKIKNMSSENLSKFNEFSTTIRALESQKRSFEEKKREIDTANHELTSSIQGLQANIDNLQKRIDEGEKQVNNLAWDQNIYQPINLLDQSNLDSFYADVKPPKEEQIAVSD